MTEPTAIPTSEVFFRFKGESSDDSLVSMLSYAIFERDRIKIEQHRLMSRQYFDLNDFILNYDYERAKKEAVDMLGMQNEISKISSSVSKIHVYLDSHIESESSRTMFNFMLGVTNGVVSNFVFAIIVILCFIIFRIDPSLFQLLKSSSS